MKAEKFLETGVKAGHSNSKRDSSAEHTLITNSEGHATVGHLLLSLDQHVQTSKKVSVTAAGE